MQSYKISQFIVFCVDELSYMLYNVTTNLKGGIAMSNTKQTSASVASKASKILSDKRYSSISKSVAGSALSQTKTKK